MKTLKTRIFTATALLTFLVFSSLRSAAQAKDSLSIETSFTPAGYMGCTGNVHLDPAWKDEPHSGPLCNKITYATTCTTRWAGIYWTNRTDDNGGANWGQYPGMDLSQKRFKRVTFWAKGDAGGEVVEFGTFGIDSRSKNPAVYIYKDACYKMPLRVVLETVWKKYTIDISSCQDMSGVIGGFYFSASFDANPAGVVFYLDDMQFER